MIPLSPTTGRPGLGDVPLDGFWRTLERCAPPLLRFGFRVSIWLVTFAPIVWGPAPRRFGRLTPPDRDRVLARLAASRFALVRQVVATIKALACLAYFTDPAVRAAVMGDADQTLLAPVAEGVARGPIGDGAAARGRGEGEGDGGGGSTGGGGDARGGES